MDCVSLAIMPLKQSDWTHPRKPLSAALVRRHEKACKTRERSRQKSRKLSIFIFTVSLMGILTCSSRLKAFAAQENVTAGFSRFPLGFLV